MNNPKLLSGKELIEHGAKKTTNSLPAKSPKEIIPNKSNSEKEEIKSILEVRRGLIADHRIEKRNTLSHAEWKKDIQKAIITDKKGPYWNYIGHSEECITYIYPEEALFLMEINSLLLSYEGVLVSIQQAYSLLLGESILLYEYRAYSQLMREGYKLLRHKDERKYFDEKVIFCSDKNSHEKVSVESSASHKNEKNSNKINEPEHTTCVKKKMLQLLTRKQISSPEKSDSHSKIEDDENLVNDFKDSNCNVDVVEDNSDDCIVISENSTESRKRKASENEIIAKKNKVYDDEEKIKNYDVIDLENEPDYNKQKILNTIVDCYGKTIIYVETPENKFLPSNINLKKPYYFYAINTKNEKPTLDGVNPFNNQICPTPNTGAISIYDSASQVCESESTSSSTLPNNTFYVNHVYQNISIQETNYSVKLERSSYYYYGNTYLENNAPSVSTKVVESDKKQTLPNVPTRSLFNPFSKNKPLPPDITRNPNPFSSTFSNSFNKHRRKKCKDTKKTSALSLDTKSAEVGGDGAAKNNSENEDNTYQQLLKIIKKCKRSIKHAKTQYLRMKMTAELKVALKKIKKCREILTGKGDSAEFDSLPVDPNIIVQVSSDSDESGTGSEPTFYHEKKDKFSLNENSTLTDVGNLPMFSSSNLEGGNNAKIDERNEGSLNKWFDQKSWSNLGSTNSKPKCNRHLMKLNTDFFSNIKKIDFEQSNIKSWQDAKHFCDNLNVNTVSISDDEDEFDKNKAIGTLFTVSKKCQEEKNYIGKTKNAHTVKISYDIYKPNCKTFKKSHLPTPSYVLLIRSIDSPRLLPQDFDAVRSKIPSDLVILVAVVSSDSVFFMEMDNFKLPQLTGSDIAEDLKSSVGEIQ